MRVSASSLDQLLHPTLDPKAKKDSSRERSTGKSRGRLRESVFTSEDAVVAKEKGEKAILVRIETSPEDIEGMVASIVFLQPEEE